MKGWQQNITVSFTAFAGAHYLTKTTQFEHTSWIMMDTSRNDFKYLLGHKINTLPLPCWHIRVVFFFSFWSDTAHPQALPIHLSVFEPPEPPTSVYITEVRHNSTSDKNKNRLKASDLGDEQGDQRGLVPGLRRQQPGPELLAPVQGLRLAMGRENQPQRQLSSLIGNCWWSFAVHRVHYSSKLFFPIGSQCHSPPSPGGEREQHWCGASKQHGDRDHGRGGWVSWHLPSSNNHWLFSSAVRAAKVGSSGGSFGDGAESILAGGETIYISDLMHFILKHCGCSFWKLQYFPLQI